MSAFWISTLASFLKCSEAGITGHKTNHSLRATDASELFEAGVPEKIIKKWTSHHLLKALHIYEHTTFKHQAVSSIFVSKKELQEAMFAPSSSFTSVATAPTSSTPTNIFNNCSVQIIQITQAPQLPLLPPPPPIPLVYPLQFMSLKQRSWIWISWI